MKKILFILLIVITVGLGIFYGYNIYRLNELEKNNNELKIKIDKNNTEIEKETEKNKELVEEKEKITKEKESLKSRYENWQKKNEKIKTYLK